LRDTTPNFPEFSSTTPRIQANHWAGPTGCSGSSPVIVDPETPPLSLADCFRPLLVLVGIPLVLLGLLSLVRWLFVR
jgi:hypothetical protein